MSHGSRNDIDRREFIKLGLTAGALLPAAGTLLRAAGARAEGDQLVTEIAANKPVLDALQYTNESAKAAEGQTCGTCQLYTAGEDGRGKCTLFPNGLVTEAGWCMSWAKIV
jgi:hypothetical protein